MILNGLGTTKYEELFVVWRTVAAGCCGGRLHRRGSRGGRAGDESGHVRLLLTVVLLDDELEQFWRAPADTPAYRREAGRQREVHRAATGGRRTTVGGRGWPSASEASVAAAVVARRASRRCTARRGHEDELGRIDAVAGDGDHGRRHGQGLDRRHRAAAASPRGHGAAACWPRPVRRGPPRPAAPPASSGGPLLEAVGGGPRRPSRSTAARRRRCGRAAGVAPCRPWSKAELGDKTMLDASIPFVEALSEQIEHRGRPRRRRGTPLQSIRRAGSEATAELRPDRPGPSARGTQRRHSRPGAVSMALCLRASVRAHRSLTTVRRRDETSMSEQKLADRRRLRRRRPAVQGHPEGGPGSRRRVGEVVDVGCQGRPAHRLPACRRRGRSADRRRHRRPGPADLRDRSRGRDQCQQGARRSEP